MLALVNRQAGGPEVLALEERADLTPGPGEVRVKVACAGLNFSDVHARQGLYPDAPPFPMVMGYEVSGTVDAVGPGVDAGRLGERVLAMPRFGGQASQVVVPQAQALTLPEGMSLEVAAALPVACLTAYHLLLHVAPLRPGMTVLVHMASGGVGLAAVQLARTVHGVRVFGTASAAKHAELKAHGFSELVDPRQEDYGAAVRRWTEGRGVHRVLDPLGGDDWRKGYGLLRPGGLLLVYGFANLVGGERRQLLRLARQFFSRPRFDPLTLMSDNRGVAGVNMLRFFDDLELMRNHLAAILGHWERGELTPVVDRTFPAGQAAEAHRYIQARSARGKVLLGF